MAKKKAAAGIFELNGKKYRVKVHKANIPGIGERTNLEICSDLEAQNRLVESNSGLIEEVFGDSPEGDSPTS
jgi:hypothetical protein